MSAREECRKAALNTATGPLGLLYAAIYVGDQLARIADLLEQTTTPVRNWPGGKPDDLPRREVSLPHVFVGRA
jgi:hypothetical protein